MKGDTAVIPFTAGDGFACNLLRVRGPREPHRGPVLLVHGAGVRANIFLAPVQRTIVDELVEAGYDVFLENWRASIEFPPNRWTLDQAALFDHPKAVAKVIELTGASRVKAVIHCQGSTSFTMALAAGLLPEVSTVVSNAVSMVPVVPWFSHFKLTAFLPLLHRMVDFLDPSWGLAAPGWQAKLIRLLATSVHWECANSVCKLVSFTYGAGFPALWRHENLNADTHEWLKREFAAVPLTFFDQILRCISAGGLVSVDGRPELPSDFTARAPQTDARVAFFAGARNRCFLPESQERAFAFFDRHQKGRHVLRILPAYGHLDVFMGERAGREVFPLMLAELEKN